LLKGLLKSNRFSWISHLSKHNSSNCMMDFTNDKISKNIKVTEKVKLSHFLIFHYFARMYVSYVKYRSFSKWLNLINSSNLNQIKKKSCVLPGCCTWLWLVWLAWFSSSSFCFFSMSINEFITFFFTNPESTNHEILFFIL
jgi:hypothetical protein